MINIADIMKLEFTENVGEQSFEKVALYNKKIMNRRKVISLLEKNNAESNQSVLVMDRIQYEIIFEGKSKKTASKR